MKLEILCKEQQQEKLALVTGASGGIGFAIAESLQKAGYTVYGIGRDFSGLAPSFQAISLDLRKKEERDSFLKSLQEKGKLAILVHSAGVAYYGLQENVEEAKIREMTELNLEIPMILTQYFLRELKENRGHIIFISSVTALERNTYGAVYGAGKAGLLSFARSLFSEYRKSGLKVHSILPDMTDTKLYRNADFTVGDEGSYLLPEDVVSAVEMLLNQREGVVLEEVLIRPQRFQVKKRDGKNR